MKRVRLLAALLLLAGVQQCLAQEQPSFTVNSEVSKGCVTLPPEVAPRYPDAAAEGRGGVVRLKMVFSDTVSPPTMDVFTNSAGEEFLAAVQAHVQLYRFHCFRAEGKAVTLIQEFQFVAKRGREVLPGALRHYRRSPTCKFTYAPPPPYPRSLATPVSPVRSGNVLVGLSFSAGQEAPQVRVFYDGGSSLFAQTASAHAAQARMKCDAVDEYPVEAFIPYRFRIEGDPEFRSEPVALADFLGVVDQLEGSRVYFDFNTMGCPFDFSIYPLQPEASNVTGWKTSPTEDRREFLVWLSNVKLKLPRKLLNDLRGNALKVHVPCVVMNFL